MEVFKLNFQLQWVIGPAVGAAIGYFTNLIAVKMLFRPRKAYYIFGHRVPLTPGAIPKGKPRLAKSIADAVTGSLLTGDDLKSRLMSDELADKLSEKAFNYLTQDIDTLLDRFDPDSVEKTKNKITEMVSYAILDSIKQLPISELIIEYGGNAIKEKTRGTMLAMFINDNLINSYAEPIADAITGYIDENGADLVSTAVRSKIDEITKESAADLLYRGGMDSEKLRNIIIRIYRKGVESAIDGMLKSLSLGSIIEDKINAMNDSELEELILQVMKKELSAIVNLGALIGLILGIINAFF